MDKTVLLFDIDSTLTPPRQPLNQTMTEILKNLRVPFHVAAGSHLGLLEEQFFQPLYDYGYRGTFDAFISNGGTHYRCDFSREMTMKIVSDFDIRDHLGEANYDFLINVLKETERNPEYSLPPSIKILGETIAFRGSMVNYVPAGRAKASLEYQENREKFVAFDVATRLRPRMLEHLKTALSPLIKNNQLTISLGGETSFDICIANKDKSNAVWTLLDAGVEKIIFIGDALFPGGNDEPIRKVVENWSEDVSCPLETIQTGDWLETIEILRARNFIGENSPVVSTVQI